MAAADEVIDGGASAPLPRLTPKYMREMYPSYLELVQAQVFFRHGERSPVQMRLFPEREWPFCDRSNYLHSEFMKAIGRFVPKEEPMPVPDTDMMMKKRLQCDGGKAEDKENASCYTKKTATMKTGLEYERAKWTLRLGTASLDSRANGENCSQDPRMCNAGQLTDVGLHSVERVGAYLRELYVDKLGILPRAIDGADTSRPVSDWLYIRATDYSRVLQSTFALLTGLYPQRTATNGGSSDSSESTLSTASFDGSFLRRFPIHTRMHSMETMHGNYACYNFIKQFVDPPISEARELKWIDDVYRQATQLKSIGPAVKRILDKPHFGSTFHPVYDELQSLVAHGVPLPHDVNHDLLASLGRVAYHQWTGPTQLVSGQRLGFSRLIREVAATMGQAADYSQARAKGAEGSESGSGSGSAGAGLPPRLGESQRKGDLLLSTDGGIREETASEIPRIPKLALYGGHDITVGPLAIVMGSQTREWLPFASALTFELFRDKTDGSHYVRTQLNDQVLQVATCEPFGKHHPKLGSSVCTLDAFFEHVQPLLASDADISAECGNFPTID
ncbi:hypothetical protein H4217_007106 [Coemansia sp. RSA 1939]|nr:hypothetical protein H4217_007106 [Coemansia sp. RSA 1939]KAJ2600741.1 hypothetical protein EV177_007092 [Coemansia sp. RSA 1804]KAJ2679855.1 hypothetical protein GGH99_005479 [Coemansia sp. RSA 1285]